MSAPSFSSFPELEAGPSNRPTPVFSSFPSIDSGRRRSKSPERATKRSRHGEDTGRKARDKTSRKDEDRDRRRHRPEKDRKENKDERDERRRKDERRRREREKAEALVGGEVSAGRSSPKRRTLREEDVGRRKGMDSGDGQPWYEASGAKKAKGGYEEPFDASANKGFIDTAGDKDALKYGTATSHAAPRFYRDGQGRVLGLNEGLRIVHSRDRVEQGIEIAPKGRPYIPRYSTRNLEGPTPSHRLLVRPEGEGDEFILNSSYVAFGTRSRRQLETESMPEYRSISKAEVEEDDDLTLLEETLGGFATLEQDVRKRTAEMERHLQTHSDDIDSWISYSTLHLKLSSDSVNTPVNAAVDISKLPQNKASAEVTLSILARALDAHPRNFTSPELHIAYLRAAETFWPPDKVTGRWKNVLREMGEKRGGTDGAYIEAQMIHLWLGYIKWREGQGFGKSDGNASNGGIDEVIEVYIECLDMLRTGQLMGDDQAREENQLYLFLRACFFMRQAGFAERALACLQALMEITFFKPDYLRPPLQADSRWFEGVLQDFEGFWDSEVPRIGEKGAKGWADTETTESPPRSAVPEPELQSSDPFERWLEAERHADNRNALPGRATDLDEDDEDPYRVILFSDIQPLLFPVRSPEVRLQLIYAYLTFLGLPFSPPDVPTTAPSAIDPHLRTAIAYNDTVRAGFWPPKTGKRAIPWQTVGGEPMEPEEPKALDSPYTCPVKCWASERNTLFARTTSWFRDLEHAELGWLDIEFVRNSFILLRPLILDPSFTLAYFAFEAAVSPKTAVKASKAILAEHRDNLVLWDGYARLERQRGNVAVARTVYATALQAALSSQADKRDAEDESDLWASWAEMEFESGEEDTCLAILVMATNPHEDSLAGFSTAEYSPPRPSALMLLKARQHYQSLSLPLSPSQLTLTALLLYLNSGINSAHDIFFRQISKVPPQSSPAEEAFQLLVRIQHIHVSRHASPASLTRDTLELAMGTFPNNTIFLSLYLWGEAKGRVYGRVQRLVSRLSTTENAGVVGHLWAVWAEAMSSRRTFWDKGGGGAERVRNALDKAINSRLGRQSVPLWRLYVEFETLMERHTAAKQLCYRAVAAIGGCKELYLLPFTPSLRPHFTPRELCDWSELITERGIRIRVPFEEYFNPNEVAEEGMVLPEDEELEDDELEFLRERQALKPY